MGEKIGDLGYVIVDCVNAERVARFWSQVLGLKVTDRSYPYTDLARSADGAPVISFQQVTERKTIKNRIHLDVKVGDLEIATKRIEKIGGKLLRVCHEGPYTWRVMADPEGNEFCIVTD